jgi:PAS domain S-box-containing protein
LGRTSRCAPSPFPPELTALPDQHIPKSDGREQLPPASTAADRFRPRSVMGRVLLAALLLVVATAITSVLDDQLGRAVLVVYLAAVAATAWMGGLRLGLGSVAASIVLYDYLFVLPRGSLSLQNPEDLLAFATLSITAAVFSALSRSMRQSLRAAEAAERRVSEILESIADPLVVHDKDWRFQYVNRPAAKLFMERGTHAAELVGKRVWDLYPELLGSAFEREMRRAVRERRAITFEAYTPERGAWSEMNCYPTSDGGLVTSWRDITERRRSGELSSRLAAIVESSEDAIVGKTLDGIVTSWNAGAERVFGYTEAEMLGKPILRLLPPDRMHEETDILTRLSAGESVEHFESVRVRKDGSLIDVSVSISPVRDASGTIISASKIARDITRQKREMEADRFLAEATAELSSSLDYEQTLGRVVELAVPRLADWCSIHVLDADGVAQCVGEAFAATLDPRLQAMLRGHVDRQTQILGLQQVLRTGQSRLTQGERAGALLGNATPLPPSPLPAALAHASVITAPLPASDRVLGVLTLAIVRAGRRYTTRDLDHATEIGRRAGVAVENARLFRAEQQARAEAEHARQEAESANRAKMDFLTTMSHELRTPLNAIAGYAELLEMGVRGAITPEQREDLSRIKRSQRHLLSLINDVLNFARIDRGHLDLRIGVIPLNETLASVETLVAPQIASKSQSYRYTPVDASIRVRADRDKLMQVVLNLLSNAMKFTPAGGQIRVECGATDEIVSIHVADTGSGIPADKLEAIFDPFVQVERSLTRTVEGTGLGLSISRDLVRAMGGDITVHSVVGEGSRFTVRLPRALAPHAPEVLASSASI